MILTGFGMGQSRIFQYDVFLSHRTGDGAAKIRVALEQLGCAVWFDNDTPLTDRRLFKIVRNGFVNSRTVLAFLSPEHRPSPWTILEMMEALQSELVPGQRLVFFIPKPASLDSLQLPAEILEALKTRHYFSESTIDELAIEIRKRNMLTVPDLRFGFRSNPLSFPDAPCRDIRRTLARLDDAITGCSSLKASEAFLGADAITVDEIRFLVGVAERILKQLRLTPEALDTGMRISDLRPQASGWGVEHLPQFAKLLRAIAAVVITSRDRNDRANAIYLLRYLADHDRTSSRLLRRYLSVEADWALVSLVEPEQATDDAWWPKRLRGVEAELIRQSKEHGANPPYDAVPFLDPDVRLILDRPKREFLVDALPLPYRVDISLHWINKLAEAAEFASQRKQTEDDFQLRLDLKAIDAELSYRELHQDLARLVHKSTLDPEIVVASIDRAALATERLVAVSESFRGIPLSSFADFFVEHMLPLLGLFILELDMKTSAALSNRAIRVITPFTKPNKTLAYEAFISECLQFRKDGHQGLSEGAPLRVHRTRFEIVGSEFRRHRRL